jgi:Zn-dependent protease with chaperone function
MITTIAYTAVSFLIAMVSSWVGSLFALRPLGKPPPVFWVNRARLAYPARMAAALNTIFLPLIAGVSAFELSEGSVTSLMLNEVVAMVIGAYLGGFVIALLTEKRVWGATFRSSTWLRNIGFRIVIRLPHFVAIFGAALLLSNTLNFHSLIILIPAVLILAFGVSGGGYIVARWIRLTRPASPRLARIVADAAARTSITPRDVYELRSSAARAMALPIWGRLIFTDKALEVLSDQELVAVCVHELAHLSEPYRVSAVRLLRGMVVLVPILLIRPFWGDFNKLGSLLYGTLFALVLTRIVAVRVARRMEERADAAGRTHQGEEGTYARALERIYEANLVPAVMSAKLRPHPHLYDRLIAAGVTPSYPRPAPPSNDRQTFATLITMVIAIVLYVLVFKALGGPVYFS